MELAGDGKARRHHPGEQQQPGRDQQDRPVVAVVDGEIDDEEQADPRHGRHRDARHARRHRRVDDRQAHEPGEEQQPDQRDVAVAHVPAGEVEIGEQEHQQRGAEHGLRGGAVDPLGCLGRREDPLEEPEIDAGIGQHRPGERGRRREDDRALDHEHDGEEQGEQPRDADDDALVEGEPGRLLAVGVLVPEVDLRHVGGAKLRHEGDGGAGIERDDELVGVRALVALGPDALARRDGGDARAAEIGPHHARADEAEMRGDQQAVDLLVGVVGEREHHPVRAGARLARLHGDAAHDAVLARRGRDLDQVAVGAVALDRRGEVDGLRVEGDAHGLDRAGLRRGEDQPDEGGEAGEDE